MDKYPYWNKSFHYFTFKANVKSFVANLTLIALLKNCIFPTNFTEKVA